MDIETSFLERRVNTLDKAYGLLGTVQTEDIEYDMY